MAIDATYLKDYQKCPEFARLRHHLGRKLPSHSPTPLDAGSAMHAGLAAWYTSFESGSAIQALESAWAPWTVRAKLEQTDSDDTIPQLVAAMKSYIAKYEEKDKGWEILDVERYLEADIAPGLPYCGIMDLRVRTPLGVIAVDHKTTSGYFSGIWWASHINSIQHVGYGALCRVLGLEWDGFMINGIKLPGKGKSGQSIQFQRSQLIRPAQWQVDRVADVIEAELKTRPSSVEEEWPRREQGCFAYFRQCQFFSICTAHPELRAVKLEEDYVEDHWNPAERGSK